MKELIAKIALDLSEFLRVREIMKLHGGDIINKPYYIITRLDNVRNNFELFLMIEDTEFIFKGDVDTIIDRLKELFLEDVE